MTGKVRGRIHRGGQGWYRGQWQGHNYPDLEDEHQQNLGGGSDEACDSPVNWWFSSPLVMFDCETTGLCIYVDHITDITAKVMNPLITLNDPIFEALWELAETFHLLVIMYRYLTYILYKCISIHTSNHKSLMTILHDQDSLIMFIYSVQACKDAWSLNPRASPSPRPRRSSQVVDLD